MRKFTSYGPIDTDLNYYVPRIELIEKAYNDLVGDDIKKGGHYITVWAPRQTGKTGIMQEVTWKLQKDERFHVVITPLQHLQEVEPTSRVLTNIANSILEFLDMEKNAKIETWDDFEQFFTSEHFQKPLILVLDEFDALDEKIINGIARVMRNIYLKRDNEKHKPVAEKKYRLHGVALIGIRSVLGIENQKGSPFNVQRSLHIVNLTYNEVDSMFKWYEKESGQKIEQKVIDRLYYELNGQPGLTCWFGELLTETYNTDKNKPIDMKQYDHVYAYASNALPNNNILNIISKAKKEPYKNLILELFKTDETHEFKFDDEHLNFLYLNGVIDILKDADSEKVYIKFPSPFVQKRLFSHFARDLFNYMGRLVPPFDDLSDVLTDTDLNIRNLMKLYQNYLIKNKEWLFKEAPRRTDMRIYEAVFHFNLYRYLSNFMERKGVIIYPEFPTGNGQIDIIIKYANKTYGLELKSFTDTSDYNEALKQSSKYGKQLGLDIITLIFFIESIDKEIRKKFEQNYYDNKTKVTVEPIFIEVAI